VSGSEITGSNPFTVPLPASAWLFLSGLGGLAFIGRKRISPAL